MSVIVRETGQNAHDKRLTLPATKVEPHFQCGCHSPVGLEVPETQRNRCGCALVEIPKAANAEEPSSVTQTAALPLENEELQEAAYLMTRFPDIPGYSSGFF